MEMKHQAKIIAHVSAALWSELRRRNRETKITLTLSEANGTKPSSVNVYLYRNGIKADGKWK